MQSSKTKHQDARLLYTRARTRWGGDMEAEEEDDEAQHDEHRYEVNGPLHCRRRPNGWRLLRLRLQVLLLLC